MAKNQSKEELAKLDETGRRDKSDRRKMDVPVAKERRKSNRRRQIDPTTCEREYTDAEIEFMHALDAYKHQSGRMFPTCSEILEVLNNLGYRKSEVSTGECCQPAEQCCQNENPAPVVPECGTQADSGLNVT